MAPVMAKMILAGATTVGASSSFRFHVGFYDGIDGTACKDYAKEHSTNKMFELHPQEVSFHIHTEKGKCKPYQNDSTGKTTLWHTTDEDYKECKNSQKMSFRTYSDDKCANIDSSYDGKTNGAFGKLPYQPIQTGQCVDMGNDPQNSNKQTYAMFSCGVFKKGTTSSAWSTTPVGVSALAAVIGAAGYLL